MKRIIVVDDQPILGTIYRTKFTAEGFQVDVASDGEEALELIQRTNPDMVLLDIMLPKIDGVEVLKRLRANPSFLTLPIIVFSSSARPELVKEAFAAGATMVLSKASTSPKQLVDIVRRTLAEDRQPLAAANISDSAPVASGGAQAPPTKGLIILLEDHADTRAIVSHVLRLKGHHVTSVCTQADAMTLAQNNRVDLFVINRGQGDSSASFCREMRKAFQNTRVIAYSTEASATEREEVLRAGALQYLSTAKEILDLGGISSNLFANRQKLAA